MHDLGSCSSATLKPTTRLNPHTPMLTLTITLQAIQRNSPFGLVELGAGTGYWAALLRKMDVDVIAYDLRPPGAGNTRTNNARVRIIAPHTNTIIRMWINTRITNGV